MSFTSKVRYRDAAVFFRRRFLSPFNGGTEGGAAGYATENEGHRCARERVFNVKIASADRIK